jgi:hypothetical protein
MVSQLTPCLFYKNQTPALFSLSNFLTGIHTFVQTGQDLDQHTSATLPVIFTGMSHHNWLFG